MSTAPSLQEPGDDSTALFAELDSLLERMLALPVSYQEGPEGTEDAGPPPRDLPPLVTIAEAMPEPVLTYTTPPPPVSFVDEGLPPQPAFDFQPPHPALERMPPAEELPAPPPPTPAATPAAVTPPKAEEALPPSWVEPLPFWLWPLSWVNRAFDRFTVPLGAPGRWLRGPGGKSLLGWVGMLLIAVAGGIALHDWFGWTW